MQRTSNISRTTSFRPPGQGSIFWLLAACMMLYLIGPLVYFLFVLPWPAVPAALSDPDAGRALITSAMSATIASALIALFGVPLGYVLARFSFPGKSIVSVAIYLPLVFPPVVSGIILLVLFGPYGLIGGPLANAGLEVDDTLVGIVLAQVFVAAPFVVVAARSAFEAVDPKLEQVATTLGHNRWSTFWRITLPLARGGIIAGLVLAWMRALGEFGATVVLAYHPYTVPVYTFVQLSSVGVAGALPLALLSLGLSIIVIGAIAVVQRRTEKSPGLMIKQRTEAFEQQTSSMVARPMETSPRAGTSPGHTIHRAPTGLSVAIQRNLPGFTVDIAFSVPHGLTVLFGPSGAGKSLTLQAIAGLFPLDSARIVLDDTVWHDGKKGIYLPPQRRHVGYVPQNYALFPHLTIAQNIAFGLAAQRRPRQAIAQLVAELVSLMQLDGLEQMRPAQLSGGQQQRVALARALAAGSQLLLLDEPFSSLDASVRETLREELLDFHERVGVPIVLVTHDAQEARMLADTIVVVQGGRVLQVGTPDAVFRSPRTRTVAALTGMRACWAGEVVGAGASPGPTIHRVPLRSTPWISACPPCRDQSLGAIAPTTLEGGEATGWRNPGGHPLLSTAAKEERHNPHGSQEVDLQIGDLRLHALVPTELALLPGQQIHVGMRTDEVYILPGNVVHETYDTPVNADQTGRPQRDVGAGSGRGLLSPPATGASPLHLAAPALPEGQPQGLPVHVAPLPSTVEARDQSLGATAYPPGAAPALLAPGVIARNQPHGSSHIVTVHLSRDLYLKVPVMRREQRNLDLSVGAAVTLKIPPDAVHVFDPAEDIG